MSLMSKKALQYLSENREQLLEKLNTFLSIPSVSTDSVHKQDIKAAVDYLESYLNDIGFDLVEQQDTGGHPLIFAEYNQAGPDAPTALFYGHYDVQPVYPYDQWKCEPFHRVVMVARL